MKPQERYECNKKRGGVTEKILTAEIEEKNDEKATQCQYNYWNYDDHNFNIRWPCEKREKREKSHANCFTRPILLEHVSLSLNLYLSFKDGIYILKERAVDIRLGRSLLIGTQNILFNSSPTISNVVVLCTYMRGVANAGHQHVRIRTHLMMLASVVSNVVATFASGYPSFVKQYNDEVRCDQQRSEAELLVEGMQPVDIDGKPFQSKRAIDVMAEG